MHAALLLVFLQLCAEMREGELAPRGQAGSRLAWHQLGQIARKHLVALARNT